MKKFFRPPPTGVEDFFDLFHLIWDQGVGNRLRPDGLCGERWTSGSLSFAFEDAGAAVSERTIDSWHSRTHLPGSANLRSLIGIVSDKSTRQAWRDVLLKAARDSRDERRRSLVPAPEPSGGDVRSESFAPERVTSSAPVAVNWRRTAIMAAGLLMFAGAGAAFAATYFSPRVIDLRFCDAKHFSVPDRVCTTNIERFDYGIRRVYVSFRILNWPDDEPFTRTWYLNGASVLERSSLTAPPWEGWTWYGSAKPEAEDAVAVLPGLYTLRVRAGSGMSARSFEIATLPAEAVGIRFRDPFHSGRGDGPEMVVLPERTVAGNQQGYRMAVSRSEITRQDWQACVDDKACARLDPNDGSPASAAATGMSWDEVFAYLQWLNTRLSIAPERWDRYTLLTGPEWDFASGVHRRSASTLGLRGFGEAPAEWLLDCADDQADEGACSSRIIRDGGEAGLGQSPPDVSLPGTGFRAVRRLDPLNAETWETPAP